MKKLFGIFLVILALLRGVNDAVAQPKIAYIDIKPLMELLPEARLVHTKLKADSDNLTRKLQYIEYEWLRQMDVVPHRHLSDAERQVLADQLQGMQKRMEKLKDSLQSRLNIRIEELYRPLKDHVKEAVRVVALEKGISYVINADKEDMFFSDEADDLSPAVKAKLGIK